MTVNQPTDLATCPACGASTPAGTNICWLCHAPLTNANPYAPPRSTAAGSWTFSLSTLMLVVTLGAVTLGIGDGLGIGAAVLFVILIAPAMVRTSLATVRRRRKGRPMAFAEKLLVLLASFGITAAVGLAACAAFCATCFAMAFGARAADIQGEALVWVAIAASSICALVAAFFMLRWLWPRKEK